MTLTFGIHKLADYLLTFISQTTIVSEKSIVVSFPIQKHGEPNLTLP